MISSLQYEYVSCGGISTVDEERYGIGELADAAGVSVRTVRYYIGEGLLPPAVTAGARSYYTREHLDRLRVIGRMKDAFLPLKEIRRQLTTLDDESIRQIADEAASDGADFDVAAMHLEPFEPFDKSGSYDAPAAGTPRPEASGFIHGYEDIRAPARPSAPPAAAPLEQQARPGRQSPASEYIARVLGRPARHAQPRARRSLPAPAPAAEPFAMESAADYRAPHAAPPPVEPAAWRRIAIGDDAELLIREETYHRRRAKVDWLIDWARKVLD